MIHWAWDASMTANGFLWPSAYAADEAWTVAGLAQQARILNDDNVAHHPLRAVPTIDGIGDTVAQASFPCNNGHFEWTYAEWGGTGTTWVGRQVSTWQMPWEASGNRFLRFGGAGSSVLQDVHISNGNHVSGRTMTPRARIRFPSGGSATIAVWALDTSQLLYNRTCTVAAGGTWREIIGTSWSTANCTGSSTFVEPTNSIPMRMEIYNNHPTNVIEVDHVRMQF